jgi:pimeloyl-ACP methyl ester carboxylesterase
MDITIAGNRVHLHDGGRNLPREALARQPVIVFIHGARQNHSCWMLQSRWFAHHGFSVLAPDLPGHGGSAGEVLPSVEAMAHWVEALLDTMRIGQAHLVGHSMGSLITLELAARAPERVLSATLLGASLPMPVSPVLLDMTRDDETSAAEMVNDWSYSAAARFGGSRLPGLWMSGMNKRLMERQKRGVFHADLAACNAWQRPMESLGGITTPTLVIAGGQDRMTPLKAGRAIASALPQARLLVLPGSGHALMMERPDEVLDALRDFIGARARQA